MATPPPPPPYRDTDRNRKFGQTVTTDRFVTVLAPYGIVLYCEFVICIGKRIWIWNWIGTELEIWSKLEHRHLEFDRHLTPDDTVRIDGCIGIWYYWYWI